VTRAKREFAFGLSILTALLLAGYVLVVTPDVVTAQGSNRDPVLCTQSVAVTGAAAATVELVALSAGKRVYVCGFVLNGAGATTATFKTGTGSACGSGTASLTGAMKFVDGSSVTYGGGPGYVMKSPAGNALCWTNSATVQVSGVVSYAQF
jgi:hypothetical protein